MKSLASIRKAVWSLLVTAVVVWLLSVCSFIKLLYLWKLEIPFDLRAKGWWSDGMCRIHVNGLGAYERGKEAALVKGDISVRFSPWEVWFKESQTLKISGANITSPYLQNLSGGEIMDDDFISNIEAEVVLEKNGSVEVRKAQVNGALGEGTLAGLLEKDGKLDLQSKWTLNKTAVEFLPPFLAESTLKSGDADLAVAYPTVIELFLQGHIEHPSVRVISNYFEIELALQ